MNELFQAVLIAQESVANRGKRTETSCGKGLFHLRLSLHGYHPT